MYTNIHNKLLESYSEILFLCDYTYCKDSTIECKKLFMLHYRLSFWDDFERILLAYCFNLDTTAKYGPYKMYGPYRFGDPVGIRTLDLLIRSQSLYPAELPSHDEEYSSPELLPLRFWQGQKESNPQPTVLETATLPVELYPYEREERT